MNKSRLVQMSDNLITIVMTLLTIDIKIPVLHHTDVSSAELLHDLSGLQSIFMSYVLSYAVIAMFWMSHHALFHLFAKQIDRTMIVINMVYLFFITLIPFSANLLGVYTNNTAAAIIYGFNILFISFAAIVMLEYALKNNEIASKEVTPRMVTLARVRLWLTPCFYLLGMLCAFVHEGLAVFFFLFPIIFNTMPGTLVFTEKFLQIKIDS